MQNAVEWFHNLLDKCWYIRYSFKDYFHFIHKLFTVYLVNPNRLRGVFVGKKRTQFSSKIGFILAAAGSAVGLGNIWRFPYLAAEYGGGIFLFTYIILAITFGFCLTVTEIAIGRKTGTSFLNAYKKLDKRFAFIGIITLFIPILILPYYSVIGGWVVHFAYMFNIRPRHANCQPGLFCRLYLTARMAYLVLSYFPWINSYYCHAGCKARHWINM